MKDRISQILKTKNITATQFADELNVQRSGISHILSGRNNPSLDFIMKIKETYPEFNLDWLILGKGPATGIIAPKEEKKPFVPDLFAQVDPPVSQTVSETIPEPPIVRDEEQLEYEVTKTRKAPSNNEGAFVPYRPKKIVRLITLYADNTFDSYEQTDN